jgi:hypothetical protein
MKKRFSKKVSCFSPLLALHCAEGVERVSKQPALRPVLEATLSSTRHQLLVLWHRMLSRLRNAYNLT